VGFVIRPPAPPAGTRVDGWRELRAAAAFALLLQRSGGLKPLDAVKETINFFVGAADDLSIDDLAPALATAGVRALADLADDAKLAAAYAALGGALGARGQVRGQVLAPVGNAPAGTPAPKVLQIFGQRFALDSLVLSKVVFDAIVFHGDRQLRTMPNALDVMAALGNDEAVRLLQSEIERYHYAANLAAVRRVVDGESAEQWNASAYGIWLDALRTLDDAPAKGSAFPLAMRQEAWRRKQLQTQIASWTELRHDTVLYVKQSYIVLTCGYPSGYVEPYPALYARLGFLAGALAKRLTDWDKRYSGFFENFAARMADLERLARKELASQPFTAEEDAFLKKTISVRMRDSGGRAYFDGWYAGLFADRQPDKWTAVVADVHTDPSSGAVLQEGVGDANLLVVAIDNQKDRAIYVGPVYTQYQFRSGADQRMTDASWQQIISAGRLPPRPDWTAPFRSPPVARQLDLPSEPPRR
jgi:hypothetical protein